MHTADNIMVQLPRLLRCSAVAVLCALGTLVAFAEENTFQPPELSNGISEALEKVRPLLQANDPKNFPEILQILDQVEAKQKPSGYDAAYLSQLRANIYLNQGEQVKAIPFLEAMLNPAYLPKDKYQDLCLTVGQLYLQDSATTKDSAWADKRLHQACDRFSQWLKDNPQPLLGSPKMASYADANFYYANALFYLKEYKKAYEVAQKVIHLAIEPRDEIWILLFAAQQESGNSAAAADTFEIFIRKFPKNKDVWLQLTQAYINSNQPVLALLTYRRAQSNGFMTGPADYTNMFNLYFQMGEFSQAGLLLKAWIQEGKVPDNEENWERVSYCMQELRRDDAVRSILDTARSRFKTGNLDFQLAQYLWYDGKYKEGLAAAELAWKKGSLSRPGTAALFLATAYLERHDLESSAKYLDLASNNKDVKASDIVKIRGYLDSAIAQDKATIGGPVVIEQPKNQKVKIGEPATLKVNAAGNAPLTYQWQKNKVAIAGATAATYTIASAKADDAGAYSVVVKNPIYTITSQEASLTIQQ